MTEPTVNDTRQIPLGPGCLLGFRDGLPALAQPAGLNLRVRLSGPLAAVEVRQSFQNPYAEAMEFHYLFAWPESASLSRFRAQVGDRLLETQPAEDLPESQRPAVLAQLFEGETAPVFSVALGLLEPGQTLALELYYAQLAEEEFHFPLTVSPRLGLADWPARASLQLLLEAPVAQFQCNLPVHQQTLANGDVLLELAGPPRHDLVLVWDQLCHRPQALLRQAAQHFVLQLLPPQGDPPRSGRDLVVLVDMSENATPERFRGAQQVARQWLEDLQPDEQFALVSFHHQIEGFEMGGFHPKTRSDAALDWLARRQPGGRADLSVLLERVLSLPRHRELAVVLIACGPVGNEPQLYAQVCAAHNPPPFHTVGLDAKVNAAFLRRLEAVTRGGANAACVRGLSLTDRGLGVQPPSLVPSILPPLGRRPVTVLGRKTGSGGLLVSGQSYDGPWCEDTASANCQNPALPMLWARGKVDEMLDELRLIQGPRASQLRQISQTLCREYRLMTEISPLAVGGKKLPSLYPRQWTRPAPAVRPKVRVLPRPVLVAEPPKVRAGLVPPEGSSPTPGGLKAKFVRAMKFESKRKPAKPILKKADPLAQARRLLAPQKDRWKDDLRALYRTPRSEQLAALLLRLRGLSENSPLLAEVYRVGLTCLTALQANHPQAPLRTAEWVQKFARLFP